LFFSDGNSGTSSQAAVNAGSSGYLNMNGVLSNGKVFDGKWDGFVDITGHPGLAGNSVNLAADGTFLLEGVSLGAGITFADLTQLGVNAQTFQNDSVPGNSLKGFAASVDGPILPPGGGGQRFSTFDDGISHATFYFDQSFGDTNNDGVHTVKVDFGGNAGTDLDACYQNILNAIGQNNADVLAVSVFAGGKEVFFGHDVDNDVFNFVGAWTVGDGDLNSGVHEGLNEYLPINHLVLGTEVDITHGSYGDLIA